MQKIVLFIEPSEEEYHTPSKIGISFLNRFAIDEDAATEILKIFELGKTSWKMSYPYDNEYNENKKEWISSCDGYFEMKSKKNLNKIF